MFAGLPNQSPLLTMYKRKTYNWTTTNSETRNKEKEIRKQTNYAILRPNRGFLLRNQKSEKIPNRFLKSILQNQKTIRHLKTKIRNPFEIRNQKSEIGNRKTEIGNRKSEIGNQKSDFRNRKTEISNQKSDFGNRKSQIRNQKSEIRLEITCVT